MDEIDFAISRKRKPLLVHLVKTAMPIELELSTNRFQWVLKWNMTSQRYQRQLEKALPESLRAVSSR
jgi:hypothetical protein